MRNNTNSFSRKATPEEILGERNGTSMGPPPTNKKKNFQKSKLLKEDGLFEIHPTYGKITSMLIATEILQKELVMNQRTKGWKEAGTSTIQNQLYAWIRSGELPTIKSSDYLQVGTYVVYLGSTMVNVDVARRKLLNLKNWDYKHNVEEWSKHKVVKGRYRSKGKDKHQTEQEKMSFLQRLKFLFFPK